MGDDDVHDAIRRLDAKTIVQWMQAPGFNDDARISLIDQFLRATSLVNPRRSASQAKKRQEFVVVIRKGFEAAGGNWVEAFDTTIGQLDLAEEGYRRILAALAQSEYAKLGPATRIWSALYRAVEEAVLARQQVLGLLETRSTVMAQTLSLRDDQGRPVSVDALTDAFVASASASLNLEGRSEKWVGDDCVITIPARVGVSEDARMQAGSNQYLSIAWRNWRGLEERVRFLGGQITLRTGSNLPEGFPDGADDLFEAAKTPDLFEIWVCQHRMNDGTTQTHLETINSPELKARTMGFGEAAPLAPEAWISHEEALAFGALLGNLGQAVVNPGVLIEGLTMPEWLRGMAVLSAIVAGPIRDDFEDIELWLPAFEPMELIDHLVGNGLDAQKAELFIDQMRFRTSSADLYDSPLIQCADGKLIAFGPALYGPNYAGILLSIFADKDVDLSGKGTDFEDKVIELLQDEGLLAARYKTTKRSGSPLVSEEYDYDVLLMWGGYLFVFECKNRSLPKDSAVLAYNFLRETRKQVRQVTRLCDSLRAYPEIVEHALGEPLGEREIVPVVLNNLPFARSGTTDGVYFYDYQALNRFFHSRTLGFKSGRYGQEEPVGQIDVVKIWKGAEPTAEDLIRQLQNPVQLHFNREQTKRDRFSFQLDERTIASESRLYREEITPDIAARIVGIPRHVMKARERKLVKRSKKKAIKKERGWGRRR